MILAFDELVSVITSQRVSHVGQAAWNFSGHVKQSTPAAARAHQGYVYVPDPVRSPSLSKITLAVFSTPMIQNQSGF
jgi:hypothetical protein